MLLDFPAVEGVFSCEDTVMVQVLEDLFPPFPSIGSQLEKLWVVCSGRLVPVADSALLIPTLPYFNSHLLLC